MLTPRTRALKRGDHTGSSPVDRRKPGSKHHLIADACGILSAVALTGGNRNDVVQLGVLIDAVPPNRGVVGKPRRRPRRLYADRGYDRDKHRRLVRARGSTPVITRRGFEHGSGLGTIRWPVKHIRLTERLPATPCPDERRADVRQAILSQACSNICLRKLILN